MWYQGWKDIGIEHNYYSNDGTEGHRVPRDKSEDDSFVADLLGSCRRNRNGLGVHHFPHYSSGAVVRAHENRVDAELLRSNTLQATKERIGGCIAASERHSQPSQERAKKRIQPSRARKRQAQH